MQRMQVRNKYMWGAAAIAAFFFMLTYFAGTTASTMPLAEARFADPSTSGLAIVPASCPSDPHTAGECDPPYAQSYYQSYYQAFYQSYYQGSYPPPVAPGVCQAGYAWNGNICIATSCPAGYSLISGTCVISSCPAGYAFVNGICVLQSSSCSSQFYCQGNDLYTTAESGDSCVPQFVQNCSWGCNGGACGAAPPPEVVTWQVRPLLVRAPNTATVTWNVRYVQACVVTGDNGDTWTRQTLTTSAGSEPTSPLIRRTIYTLSCTGNDGSQVTRTETVNIVPVFEEQ